MKSTVNEDSDDSDDGLPSLSTMIRELNARNNVIPAQESLQKQSLRSSQEQVLPLEVNLPVTRSDILSPDENCRGHVETVTVPGSSKPVTSRDMSEENVSIEDPVREPELREDRAAFVDERSDKEMSRETGRELLVDVPGRTNTDFVETDEPLVNEKASKNGSEKKEENRKKRKETEPNTRDGGDGARNEMRSPQQKNQEKQKEKRKKKRTRKRKSKGTQDMEGLRREMERDGDGCLDTSGPGQVEDPPVTTNGKVDDADGTSRRSEGSVITHDVLEPPTSSGNKTSVPICGIDRTRSPNVGGNVRLSDSSVCARQTPSTSPKLGQSDPILKDGKQGKQDQDLHVPRASERQQTNAPATGSQDGSNNRDSMKESKKTRSARKRKRGPSGAECLPLTPTTTATAESTQPGTTTDPSPPNPRDNNLRHQKKMKKTKNPKISLEMNSSPTTSLSQDGDRQPTSSTQSLLIQPKINKCVPSTNNSHTHSAASAGDLVRNMEQHTTKKARPRFGSDKRSNGSERAQISSPDVCHLDSRPSSRTPSRNSSANKTPYLRRGGESSFGVSTAACESQRRSPLAAGKSEGARERANQQGQSKGSQCHRNDGTDKQEGRRHHSELSPSASRYERSQSIITEQLMQTGTPMQMSRHSLNKTALLEKKLEDLANQLQLAIKKFSPE
ncbi:hypothetical protein BX600DRAFT_166112 [Xylariales sp. PMI_506]|nr:hypothetical protein BX600DRAFT_166112 [Xylariales sp. PMI_506]